MKKRDKKQRKRFSLKTWCIIILIAVVCAGLQSLGVGNDKKKADEAVEVNEGDVDQTLPGEEKKEEEPLHDIVIDGETIYGYYDVIREVRISNWGAVDVERIEDWESGAR